jgi:hypothetical protein
MPYHVYVIELEDAIGPRANSNYPQVYVGQTWLTPDERFAQHKAGLRASRHVKRYGKWLRRKLYERYNPIATQEEAKAKEAWLAEHLRRMGYTVKGGH